MPFLVPAGLKDAPTVKLAITSVATISSNSLATSGSGLVQVPFYAWINAEGATGIFACYNGTAGSLLFRGSLVQGSQEVFFWTNPGGMAQSKGLVIETTGGQALIHEFHVYAKVVRGGIGTDALAQ